MKADNLFSVPYVVALAALLSSALCAFAAPESQAGRWVGTWSAPMAQGYPGQKQLTVFSPSGNQTIREIVHTSVGGKELRIRLANTFGNQTLTLDAVYVGLQDRDASLTHGSNHAVTFGGSRKVEIPSGGLALSDPVPLQVGSEQNVVVSLFMNQASNGVTEHASALTTNYVATGNAAADETGNPFNTKVSSWFYLSGVDVLTDSGVKGAVVALGDSITDGSASKANENGRWTDVLARRFLAGPAENVMSVLNEGYGGNNVLTSTPCFDVNAVARLDRDVIAQTGVRDVILLEGINDISQPDFAQTGKAPIAFLPCLSQREVTAEQIIDGYKQIIAQAHAMGLKIFGGTLTPYQGFAGWTAAGEAKREAVNRWIMTSGAYDGVIDFAKAVADPQNPLRFAPQYDSGDHLHPNTAGHKAMGEAVDLSLFR